ncbi:MAG: response regulator transcription factor [bacterium]
MNYTIFVIEDDQSISELLEIALKSYSYDVHLFEDAESALDKLEDIKPDLIICDVMLPNLDGVSAISKVRTMPLFKSIPIILLTAKDNEFDKIKGLDAGADDYVTKPFSIMELMARVRSQFRKLESTQTNSKSNSTPSNSDNSETQIKVGNIVLDNFSRDVFVDEQKIELTFKEFELLNYLLKNKNKSISREEILNKIWGYDYSGETRTVDIHIKTLRKKLLTGECYIKTIRGVGYKVTD